MTDWLHSVRTDGLPYIHCIALHCIVLHCIVLHCIVRIALHCITCILTERNVNSMHVCSWIVPSVTFTNSRANSLRANKSDGNFHSFRCITPVFWCVCLSVLVCNIFCWLYGRTKSVRPYIEISIHWAIGHRFNSFPLNKKSDGNFTFSSVNWRSQFLQMDYPRGFCVFVCICLCFCQNIFIESSSTWT
jgi:hypothetical protein